MGDADRIRGIGTLWQGNLVPTDPTLRTFEQASGTLTVTNPITGATLIRDVREAD